MPHTDLATISHAFDFPTSEKFRKSILALRGVIFVGIALLVAGSSLIGNYNDASSVTLGLKLAKAGYIVFVFILGVLAATAGLFWLKMSLLCPDSKKVGSFEGLKHATTNMFERFSQVYPVRFPSWPYE
jgi:hypothetical protein